MIEAVKVSKEFDEIKAVDEISADIMEGNVFGLVGTNGAGKSTFLRMLSGIIKPDSGSVKIDGMEVFENIEAKKLFFYISDEQYFFSNATSKDLKTYYQIIYPNFDGNR
ncbi:MAG: ATP-binding cassette domain-containing protein, partial [Anaerocolumna sp.]